MNRITIDVKEIYGEQAKLAALPEYVAAAKAAAGRGNEVVLTGPGPVWLYLVLAHALHGIATRLVYNSPATGDVVIFDHNPF
jgi:CRISPR-associated Csx3 family protein